MRIEFSTDNAAFCDPETGEHDNYYLRHECAHILYEIKEKVLMKYTSGVILDSNGNKIGEWSL